MSSVENKRSWARWLPGIVVSAVIVMVLVRLIDFQAFLAALQHTNFLYVFIAFCLMALANLARSAAWRELLGKKISLRDSFFIVNEGYLLNQIIPRSGEIGRAVLVNSVVEMNFFQALSSVVIERAIDLCVTALLFLATIGRAVALDWIVPVAITILAVVLVVFIVLFWAIRKRERVEEWCDVREGKSEFFRKYISKNLKAILNGAEIIRKPAYFLRAVFWILVCWSLWIAVSYLLLVSFVGEMPLWWAVFIQSILAFGIALPSAPAGLGVFEGTLVAALAVFRIDNEIALGYAIVMHVVQLLAIGVLGLVSLTIQGNSLRALVEKVLDRLRVRRSEDGE
ncbi:MAG: flippase-like domain-containing protein [Chloroflexi bacterium]|nr:flippase-like domain-containing protein [Chloroflexota bacterium]